MSRMPLPCALPAALALALALPSPAPRTAFAGAPPEPAAAATQPAPRVTPAFGHEAWDALLHEHVRDGLLDYRAIAASRDRLDGYLLALAEARGVSTWDRDEQLAFWINAYNAVMVRHVLDHYPIRGRDASHPPASVLQVPGIFQRLRAPIAGADLTLDQVEHEIVRPRFQEPRAHFALVCASASCPELRAEAYLGERLDEQLADQARAFLTDPRRNVFDADAGRARLSRIFEWFAEDFAPLANDHGALRRAHGAGLAGVLVLAADHLPPPEREAALAGRLTVEFLDYDWSLNDVRR